MLFRSQVFVLPAQGPQKNESSWGEERPPHKTPHLKKHQHKENSAGRVSFRSHCSTPKAASLPAVNTPGLFRRSRCRRLCQPSGIETRAEGKGLSDPKSQSPATYLRSESYGSWCSPPAGPRDVEVLATRTQSLPPCTLGSVAPISTFLGRHGTATRATISRPGTGASLVPQRPFSAAPIVFGATDG